MRAQNPPSQELQKTIEYYRRQLREWNVKQKSLWEEQKRKLKHNVVLKYVWADDIRKVKLRRRGEGGGIKVWTRAGDEAVLMDVEVELPDNVTLS